MNFTGKGSFFSKDALFFPRMHFHFSLLNPLPNNNFSDWSKFKVFADDKRNVTKKQKFFLGLAENIVRKREDAGYQHFLLFPQCFQKVSFSGSLKSGLCGKELNKRSINSFPNDKY